MVQEVSFYLSDLSIDSYGVRFLVHVIFQVIQFTLRLVLGGLKRCHNASVDLNYFTEPVQAFPHGLYWLLRLGYKRHVLFNFMLGELLSNQGVSLH
jgi:hypothetical protein